VIVALGATVQRAIEQGNRDLARERYEQALLLAESAQRQQGDAWLAVQRAARAGVLKQAEASLAKNERATSAKWADLAVALGTPPDSLRDLRARIEKIPTAGDLMRDGEGPELSFVPATLGRSVVDAPFALMRSEVTRTQYGTFAAQTGRAPARCRNRLSPLQLLDKRAWNSPGFDQAGTHPVVCVSFDDARAYAAWLSKRSGQRYRLPTLKEWRHAAQVGSIRDVCQQGNVLDRSAAGGTGGRYDCSDAQAHTAPVRSYRANGLAVHDMIGNAGEWTLSCGESGNAIARMLENESCPRRAAAGLSWREGSNAIPASHVQMLDPDRGHDDIGFRLLRELAAPPR
jgi:serine/threonine-protein kinase PpkA